MNNQIGNIERSILDSQIYGTGFITAIEIMDDLVNNPYDLQCAVISPHGHEVGKMSFFKEDGKYFIKSIIYNVEKIEEVKKEDIADIIKNVNGELNETLHRNRRN